MQSWSKSKFESYTTTKIINMNREELKRMWFNSPTSNVVTRTIRLEMDTTTKINKYEQK